jgi:chromate transporter
MNFLLLYFLLLKSTITSFSGLSSLPIVRNDLVLHYQVLTDRELSAAVAAGRAAPGPNGSYLVAVGYFAGGIPGAGAGALAVMTPAFLIIPILRYLGSRAETPAVKSAIETVTLAAAGLIVTSIVPLARDALTGPLSITIALAGFFLVSLTRVATFWIILGAAFTGWIAALTGVAVAVR